MTTSRNKRIHSEIDFKKLDLARISSSLAVLVAISSVIDLSTLAKLRIVRDSRGKKLQFDLSVGLLYKLPSLPTSSPGYIS